jgi:chromosome partitioning protein
MGTSPKSRARRLHTRNPVMAEIICILGNKGGTGKTTLSHMLSQGLGLLGYKSACVLTDTAREPLSPEGRRYITADARTPDSLNKVIEKLAGLEGWLGVIDGGGNRPEMDHFLYDLGGIVILPFRESHEDMRTVMMDLEDFPRAYALPSQWPTNPWQREAADRNVGLLMGNYSNRLLQPIPALSATKLLLHKKLPSPLPSPLSNACRAFARQVLDVLELSYAQEAEYYGVSEEEVAPAPSDPKTPSTQSTAPSPSQAAYSVGAHYLGASSAQSMNPEYEEPDEAAMPAPPHSEVMLSEDAEAAEEEEEPQNDEVQSDEEPPLLEGARDDEVQSQYDEASETMDHADETEWPATEDMAEKENLEHDARDPEPDLSDKATLMALEEDPFPLESSSPADEDQASNPSDDLTPEAVSIHATDQVKPLGGDDAAPEGTDPSEGGGLQPEFPSDAVAELNPESPALGTRESPYLRRETTGSADADIAPPPPSRPVSLG